MTEKKPFSNKNKRNNKRIYIYIYIYIHKSKGELALICRKINKHLKPNRSYKKHNN